MKLPTIRDIAAEAGVNMCVVSHVLHNDAYAAKVRPETRKRILAIAEKIGYRRNSLASATRTGQVNTIAVILNFRLLQNLMSASQLMIGIMMETSRRKLSVKIFSEEDLDNAFRTIVEDRIDKVISASVDAAPRERTAELAEKYGIKLAFCYEHGHGKFPAVNTDNAEMTARAVHYLAEHGHTRIGLFCVPHRWHYMEDRHAGYLRGMEECGLKIDPRWISCSDDLEPVIASLLALPPKQRPTAFVTIADAMAARAQQLAVKHGLRLPEDFSVIGIGDMECAAFAAVPITTFRESLAEAGKLLVHLVLGEKPDYPPDEYNVYRTHAELIERESVCDLANRKIQVSRYKSQDNRKQRKGNRT